MISAPVKPFPTYKWRWLSVAPTESLLTPPIFLGVLRVLARHENESPGSQAVLRELAKVAKDTKSPVNLVRTSERNLIRNSGQYWKGTGLMLPESGLIQLTPLGRMVAQGGVTQGEFAAIMVQQTVLPNPLTYSEDEVEKWRAAELEIRPLVLILDVLKELGSRDGGADQAEAYMTPDELITICIPLAGTKAKPALIARAIAQHRARRLDVSGWPDCAPSSNDHRFAKEFLKFLADYGFCRRIREDKADNDRYCIDELYDTDSVSITPATSMFTQPANTDAIVEEIRHSSLPSIIERQRTLTTVLTRPGQSQFRQLVLKAYSGRCFLTGDSIGEILEAAHIIPVPRGGADKRDNGICLRVDIHHLFDSHHIRIRPNGDLQLSGALRASKNYTFLPDRIDIPRFVKPANIQWRDNYS